MSEEFILIVGDKQFLLGLDEAMQIAGILNSASTVSAEWIRDVPSGQNRVSKPPALIATVSPLTAILKMEMEHNRKLLEKNK